MAKHILVISQCFYPEEFRINDISAQLVKRGYRVTALTGIPNYPQGKFYKGYGLFRNKKENWNGIDIIHLPIIPRGSSKVCLVLNYVSFVISGFFWGMFSNVKPDIVFSFETSPMTQVLIGTRFSKKNKIPHFLYVQDLWPENVEIVAGVHNKKILDIISSMVNYIYRHCTKIFTTSPSFVENIRDRVEDKQKVVFIPQYAEDFYKPADKIFIDEIPDDGFFKIIFTGNIGVAQGLEILPETAAILKNNDIRVKFVMVGDGRARESFENSISKFNVGEMFILLGRRKAVEIPSLISMCDAAFLSFMDNPLFKMTIPAKLQSYMACGIPVIAAASGETERIIKEAGCGECSPLGSSDALASLIVNFMHRDDLKRMGRRAVEYSNEHFDREAILNLLERELFDSI